MIFTIHFWGVFPLFLETPDFYLLTFLTAFLRIFLGLLFPPGSSRPSHPSVLAVWMSLNGGHDAKECHAGESRQLDG